MKFFPRFIFRSPLFPVSGLRDESAFSEALYLSTPVLHEEYRKHLKHAIANPKDLKKLNISLYKYQTRASNRCTPFGLFAGLSIGEWAEENKICIDQDLHKALNRKTRLDMNVVCSLAQELAKHPFIKNQLKFYPNTSIYLIGNSYRYVEYYYLNSRRFHKLNRVDFTPYLEYILREAKTGLTQNALADLLTSHEVSAEEAAEFIEELIASQLLVSQLAPTVTGDDYFNVLLKGLKNLSDQPPELRESIAVLEEIDVLIRKNDASILNETDSYKKICETLKTFLPELTETNLFQTDLYKNTLSNSLSNSVQAKIGDVITFLNKITPASESARLMDFKKRFYERYEENEIPLLVALDTETGIGYLSVDSHGVNELVEDIQAANRNAAQDVRWDELQPFLLKLITDSIRQNKRVISIDESHFNNIDYSTTNLPHSYPVMFKVLDTESNRLMIESIGGSSAINLLGRFSGGHEELGAIVGEIARFEQEQLSTKILAEIVHLPESRTGNILARPCFRNYEIPYLAQSTVSDEFQIHPENLTVKIRQDKIILFDRKSNSEIIPRLGNAHNFSANSLPVYHFLCDLQTHQYSKAYLGFNWGVLASQFGFLPRVEYRDCVLSPAKWQLVKKDLEPLLDKKKSDAEKQAAFFELKNRVQLPGKFLVVDGDNELLIDTGNLLSVDTFLDMIKSRNELKLEEYLFSDEHALIRDTAGNSYSNECIAIVLNDTAAKTDKAYTPPGAFKSKQNFSIGSEWLYYKIYCGAKTADLVLTEKIREITAGLSEKKSIDKWFFIRYADPQGHLRLRLHIPDLQNYGDVLRAVHEALSPLLENMSVSRLQTDTYKRELERYGDSSIEMAETLFHHDSVFVTSMLDMLDADSGGEIRWQIAIRSVDEFLNDFGLPFEEKQSLITSLSEAFANEHGADKNMKVSLDSKFRKLKARVEQVLDRTQDAESDYYPIIGLLEERSRENKAAIAQILGLRENGLLQVELNNLLGSLLHMNLDRLFMGRNRTNEFVVYDLLSRYYKSISARQRQLQKNMTAEVNVQS